MKKKDQIILLELLKQYYSETKLTEAEILIQHIQNTAGKRSGGRKPVYSADIRQMILKLHDEGDSIRRIACITGCSVGYVHKTIHNRQQTGGKRDCAGRTHLQNNHLL